MHRHTLLIVVATSMVCGCVPNKMYRPGDTTNGEHPERNYFFYEQLETRDFEPMEVNDANVWRYRLGFVEFDDRGEMFKREQLRRTVQEIAKAKAEATARAGEVIVAVFVHGWKNNASDSSGNVWGFRQVLAGLSKQFNTKDEPDKVVVLGVYIGWRGAVLSPPILKQFTIFDRQQKSQNLTGAHLVEALVKIMQAAKGPDYTDRSTATLLMGHSFGGAVLETALTQTLVGMAVRAKATGTPMQWPANVIMFVNEAQEATRSYQLIEAFRENLPERDAPRPGDQLPRPNGCVPAVDSTQTDEQRDRPAEAPAIVSISSTGDYATRVAFKGSQGVQRPFHSLRTYDEDEPNFLGIKRQTSMFLNTTAHMKEFQSHLIGRCRCEGQSGDPDESCDPENLRCEDPVVEAARNACKVNIQARLGSVYYAVVEKPKVKNRTPYWVLQMPPTIVADHSTIFTPIFRNFVIMLLQRATMSASPEP
jgi:hypothetical protein